MWQHEQLRRIRILIGILAAIILLLIIRMAWLQLLQGAQYKKTAEQNRIRQVTAQAPRGVIYDRNGAILVSSRPSFAVSIILSEFNNSLETKQILSTITGVSVSDIDKMVIDGQQYPYTPIRLKRNIDDALIAKINERKYLLPGVIIEALPIRHYAYKELAAHVLGYIGNIDEGEYESRKQQGYRLNDLIGKDGLEREWEDCLRGQDGGLQVEVNAQGEEVQLLGNKQAVPGKGLVITIDANLQKVVEDILSRQVAASRKMGHLAKGGCVIVINVHNGAILAMASNPAFDPNEFAAGISSSSWSKLANNTLNPLANKCIQYTYPPGSVFKIVTAAAALDLGLTTPAEVFEDKGVYVLNGWSFYGWEPKGLGKLNIKGALAWSSDPVFYELGNRVGVNRLADYAVTFGFGRKTGIRLQGEEAGIVPTTEWKLKKYDEQWYPGETLIAAIGQGYYLTTPLQQTMLLMAVANNGIMYKPVLVEKVLSSDGAVLSELTPEIVHSVYLAPNIWDSIREGLVGVTTTGTAAAVFRGFSPVIAGKTGSAETGRGTTHSWFACYAPADKPEIVVTALVEEGGDGSIAAAPIVRLVLEEYFK